ncbi:alpha/beta hydrolase [uncultured Ruminococcus sp.]|uniref:alpha/beta hydrolase n=1 Tax=uncultured Ruminococcus sp. TaxID=165186 RepID=UPI0025E30E3C|nr:alpha/beta hydrolase-fold protein [uncultured Ruminococcus sp.]
MRTEKFSAGGKTVTVHDNNSGRLILLNNYEGDGSAELAALKGLDFPAPDMIAVSGVDWEHDLSPFKAPAIRKNEPDFTGGADGFLALLTSAVLPQAEMMLSKKPVFKAIAGYSLAGLFALWSLYRCDCFDAAASVSGSLWFEGFRTFAERENFMRKPNAIYLSLGDKEAKTRHPLMRTVQENTEALAAHYKKIGINTVFELNEGNHFKDPELRTAKGVAALLSFEAESGHYSNLP